MQQIKNIILDLGGVILDIDYPKTVKAFAEAGIKNFPEYYSPDFSSELFQLLEKGKITPDAFYQSFRKITNINVTSEQIKNAWNAMLIKFSPAAIDWLDKKKNTYRLYLFSNTNEIHYNKFTQIFKQQTGRENFDAFFIKAYYSHILGLRKPYPDSFLKIIEEQKLNLNKTVFIDDSSKNIEGAKQVGLKTMQLTAPKTLDDLDL